MLAFAFIVEIGFVIGFPLLLGAWLHRRFKVSWLIFAIGAVTFGVSQAVHFPLNQVLFWLLDDPASLPSWALALTLGLTAGLCEETARYVAYRWALPEVRQWRQALMFGAGHGGIESIVLVGLLVGATFLNMTTLQAADLETWALPAGQMAQLQAELQGYWEQAWTTPLLAAAERLFTIIFHMGMAVLVLQAVIRGRLGYWLLAVVAHTATNALVVITASAGWPLAATEAVVGLFALAALGVILLFRPREPEAIETVDPKRMPSLPPLQLAHKQPPAREERLRRQIEDSRYE